MKSTPLTLSALGAAAVLALAGCSAPEPNNPAEYSTHDMGTTSPSDASVDAAQNEADEMFASMMVVHHEQAIEMSDILLSKRGLAPEIQQLAQDIKDAQSPEIETLRTWQEQWNVPSEQPHSMGEDDGMVSEENLEKLRQAEADEGATLYLEQMIAHHEGAVEMAEQELSEGRFAQAKDMAQRIVDSQTAEIEQMNDLLSTH
ncbi:DUF305 domain-containing protein [Glutamicibacter protophormiae]